MKEFGPGREIFLEPDGKVPENEAEMPRRFTYQKLEAETETGTEIKKFVTSVDFKALRNMFEEEYRRAGLDPSAMNFVGPEHVYGKGGWSNMGVYKAEANLIGVNVDDVSRYAMKHGLDPRLLLLHALIHEQDHAVQKIECHIGKNEYEDYLHDGYIRQRRGPEVSVHGNKELKKFFESFGEGVTDKMTLEMTLRYVAQKRFADDAALEQFSDTLKKNGPYAWNHHVVDVFINKLSRSSGLAPDVIWGAIKAGALRGDNLYNGELREFLDSELGSEFMDELENDRVVRQKVVRDRSKLEQGWRDAQAIVLKMVRKITR